MVFTQSQVNNLVDKIQQDASALLTLNNRLKEDVQFYTAIGGQATVESSPPSGDNSGITSAAVVNVVAHINAITADIDGRAGAMLAILDGVPA